jgi:sulfonate transport system permease protein
MTQPVSLRRRLRGLAIPVCLVALWEVAGMSGFVDRRLFPSIETILRTAYVEIREGDLLHHVLVTILRDLKGFAIGAPLGIAFGSLLGLSKVADILFGPLFRGIRQIAILAWIPLICMWLGLDETAKVTFIAMAAFVPASLSAYQGMRSASRQLKEVSLVLRLTRRQTLRNLYFPSAYTAIVDGLLLALVYSWLATIASEYFMAIGQGIGGLILAGRDKLEMELVIIGIVLLGTIGYAISTLARRLAHSLGKKRFTY